MTARSAWSFPAAGLVVLVGAASGAFDATTDLFPLDISLLGTAADTLLSSRWASAFASPDVQVGPLHLLVLGLLRALARGLDVSQRLVLSGFIQAGCALGVFLVVGRVLERPRPLAGAGAALAAVFGGVGWTAYISGHPEEPAIGLLWIYAGMAAWRGRGLAPGLLLAAATALKLSGALGVPLLLLVPAGRPRVVALTAFVSGTLLTYVPFFVFGDVGTFGYAWGIRSDLWAALLGGDTFPWWLRLLQGAVTVGAGTAALAWARRSASVVWILPLAVTAVRIALDPHPQHYFWLSFELAAIVGAATVVADAPLLRGVAAATCAYAAMIARYLAFLPGFGARVVAGGVLVALARAEEARADGSLDPAPSGALGPGGEEAVARPRGPV